MNEINRFKTCPFLYASLVYVLSVKRNLSCHLLTVSDNNSQLPVGLKLIASRHWKYVTQYLPN